MTDTVLLGAALLLLVILRLPEKFVLVTVQNVSEEQTNFSGFYRHANVLAIRRVREAGGNMHLRGGNNALLHHRNRPEIMLAKESP